MIKAIIFDLDDTLYDQKSPFVAALTKTYQSVLSQDELAKIFNRFHDFNEQTFNQVMDTTMSLEAWQTARIRHALATHRQTRQYRLGHSI
ncbi:HAD family hydrolase [Lactiplantibacillus pentosus]|uniref:HAD hydrolase-like protein n=1 Tax=Lactiplantibacillus pentosus TaxID=1589 RepID=UPI0021A8DD1C|nr:HAD hydrolase-like protein [Lactiplantibacillus pentosus]